MAAEPFRSTAAFAFALDRSEHVRQIAGIVTGIGHDPRSENVGLRFVFAAELRHPDLSPEHTKLGACLSTEYCPAEDHPQYSKLFANSALFGRLSGRMTKCNVADLVGHYAGHFALITGLFDHAAVNVHWAARKGECIDVAGVHNLKTVNKCGLVKLLRDGSNQTSADIFDIVCGVTVV